MICASIREAAIRITVRAFTIEVIVRIKSMTALQMTVVGLDVDDDCLGFAYLEIASNSAVRLLVPESKPIGVKPEKDAESS